jgi:very-short-patch-repair endonuclease
LNDWPNYNELDVQQKIEFITSYHTNGDYSLNQLAKLTGTYVNKIKRDAKKFGVKTDTKSESQAKALRTGAISHPTMGKERSDETKDKIGKSRRETWKEMSDDERESLSKARKAQYKKQKIPPHLSPNKATNLQKAAKFGSKIELAILQYLRDFWSCEHQAEDQLGQETYHVDIMIRELNIAIEVDGPAHYKEIWNADKLNKTKQKDERKTELITSSGYALIRAIADKKFSKSYGEELAEKVREACVNISNGNNAERVVYVKI